MKKRILIIALAAIVAGCAIGGTIAYYTNQNTVTNVITAGNIKVALQEWADLEMTKPYADPEDAIMPGEEVTKVVTAKNTGDNAAWIRIQFVTTAEGETVPADGEIPLLIDVDADKWILQDGWYYYNDKLAPGDTASPLFTTVTFESGMGNDWQNATIHLTVDLEAVQVANNGDTVLDAAGWPAPLPLA